MDLTDNEKRDLIKLIENNQPIPENYRFKLFKKKDEIELLWNGKSYDTTNDIPSILDTSIKPGERKNILLIKVPYIIHPESNYAAEEKKDVEDKEVSQKINKDEKSPLNNSHAKDFKTITPFRPIPSLALATLSAFFEKYKSHDYNLKCIDINTLIYDYQKPGDNKDQIDTKLYVKIIEDTLKKETYDILAISAMFVMSQRWVSDALKYSRQYNPKAKIIMGGGYPTIYPEYVIRKHDIDVSVVGEGDDTFLHVINGLNNVVDKKFEEKFPFEGYAGKDKSGKIFYVPRKKGFIDLDSLPPATFEWLDIKNYFKKSGNNILPIEASRGCPYGCTYCNTFISWGKAVRYKNVDSLIGEMSKLKLNYGAKLHFVDDNLSFSKDWTIKWLDKLAEKKLDLDVSCSNFHYRRLDEEILDKLFKIGVKEICIALETGSDSMNKKVRRRLDWERARRVVEHVRKRGRHSAVFWMVGFPGESMDELNETFKMAKEIKSTRNLFSIVMPYPGTKLWDDAKNLNALIVDDNSIMDLFYYRSSKGNLKSKEWTTEKINNMAYDAQIDLNFLNSPGLETDHERKFLKTWLKDVILRYMPQHIIANILLAHLLKEDNEFDKSDYYYKKSMKLFSDDDLKKTFQKYLYWDNKIIKGFLDYTNKENSLLTSELLSSGNVQTEYNRHSNPENLVN